MTTFEEYTKLLAVKLAFEMATENFKQQVEKVAEDLGVDVTLNVDIKVNGVNLEQYDETMSKFRKKFENNAN